MRISDWSSDVCSSDLRSHAGRRAMPLEDFFLAYRKTALQPGEFVESVTVRKPGPDSRFAVYKLSKRFDQDISDRKHTSELQSLMRISYAVFCLKKKKTTIHIKKIKYR